jgi:hypothetical protein
VLFIQRSKRYWRHRRRLPRVIDLGVYEEALRAGVKGTTLLPVDRLAVTYRIVVTLAQVLIFVVTFTIINNISAIQAPQSDKVPGWFSGPAFIALVIILPVYINMRFSKKLATHRLASRLAEAINLLRRSNFDKAAGGAETLRDRQVALRQATSELRNIRDGLERVAWQVSADLAVLAGDRPSQRRDELHSRLGRVLKWAAERPYDNDRRRTLLVACGVCAERITDVRIMEPLPFEVPAIDIRPKRNRRLRRATFDLAGSHAFLAGLATGLVSIGIQYVLKRFAGG